MKKTENNKLIADFMGYKTDEYGMYSKENGRGFFKSIKDNKGKTFDTSWDWLMPVVEKIISLYPENNKFDICIKFGTVDNFTSLRTSSKYNSTSTWNQDIKICEQTKGIVTIYKTVVTFIKWYSENKED